MGGTAQCPLCQAPLGMAAHLSDGQSEAWSTILDYITRWTGGPVPALYVGCGMGGSLVSSVIHQSGLSGLGAQQEGSTPSVQVPGRLGSCCSASLVLSWPHFGAVDRWLPSPAYGSILGLQVPSLERLKLGATSGLHVWSAGLGRS